jgi:hypothetical protein
MYIQNQAQQQASKWLHTNFHLHRGIFVTYHFIDSLGFNRSFNTRLLLEKVNKRLLRKLEKKLGFNDRTRLNRLVFIEKGRTRNHTHMMVETPIHVSNQRMIETIIECIESSNKIVSLDIQPVREKQELISYLTKEVTEQNSDCIDVKNTFIKKRVSVFSIQETM